MRPLTIDAGFAIPCLAFSGKPCTCTICFDRRWHAAQEEKRAKRLAWENSPERLAEIEQSRADRAAWLASPERAALLARCPVEGTF